MYKELNCDAREMHVQSCCFADLNLLLFCRSRLRRRRRCLSSLLYQKAIHPVDHDTVLNNMRG